VVANVGDSRAVLCRRGTAVQLTEDHKPSLPKEEARISAAGGFIAENAVPGGRVDFRANGDLNLSRALGDLRYKTDTSRPGSEQVVSSAPDTTTLRLQAGDEFVLLASDGVWECMGAQEVVNFVRRRLAGRLVPALEALVEACCAAHPTQRGGLGCDNITALLIHFDPGGGAGGEILQEVEERTLSGPDGKKIEAALGQILQRLSGGRMRREETRAQRMEREERQREEKQEQERREQDERERIKRKERRQNSGPKKRARCCAAAEDDASDEAG